MIGGSGGGGGGATFGHTGSGGGGGGGALVIASSGTIVVTGSILAKGGNGGAGPNVQGGPGDGGGGSGGAVRLIATTITGTGGTINAAGGAGTGGSNSWTNGGAGAAGRVRLEAYGNTLAVSLGSVPGSTLSTAAPSVVTLASGPTLQITAVAGVTAPAQPSGSFVTPDLTLPASTTNPVSVSLAAANIPVGTVVTVTVTPLGGASSSTTATLAGTNAASSASASVTIPTNQPSLIGATATFTLLAAAGGGPVYVQGQPVERVRVTTMAGRGAEVAYLARDGRALLVVGTP
jgi:hypothetical protein